MADTETAEVAEADEVEAGEAPAEAVEHVAHPDPSAYVWVAVILAIVTAAEVSLFYIENISDVTNTIALLILMTVKFFLVVMWFMHLKFEALIFRRLFYGGLVLAVAVYAITLAASHVFPFGA